MSIRRLPDDVVRQIKSSVVITSLNDAVLGLIKNSLDAEATKINISVEYARGNCSAEDDGLGIPPDEFRETGGLGKHHYTSRYPPADDVYGSHGAFLSSLATLSLTSITSHHHEHRSHNTITIHHATVLARHTPALPEHRLRSLSSDHGTRVVVRDLFGPMPVRVKQRPLATDKSALDREFSRLVRSAVAIVLAYPRPVAISLRDGITGNHVRLRPPPSSHTSSHLNARSDADADTLVTRVSTSLVQAGLADDVSYGTWVPVAASTGGVSVRGCVSLNAVATRRAQFISLGIHPLHNEHNLNILYDQVNRVFSHSAFSAEEDGGDTGSSGPTTRYTARQLRTRRSLDRWPMFFFRVELSSSSKQTEAWRVPSLDETLDRSNTLSAIIDLLARVSFEFLKKHHFRPHSLVRDTRFTKKDVSTSVEVMEPTEKRAATATATAPSKRKHARSATPLATAPRRPESPFDLWQRVKVGRARQARSPARQSCADELPLKQKRESPLIDENGRLLRQPFDDVDPPRAPVATGKNEESCSGADDTPTTRSRSSPSDAATTQTTVPASDMATAAGASVGEMQRDASTSSVASAPSSREEPPPKRIRLVETATTENEPSEWVKKVASAWENPVFPPPVDPPIPRIGETTTTGSGGGDAKDSTRACRTGGASSSSSDPSIVRLEEKLSRGALRRAQVIAQVDRKFMLVRFPSESRSLLVLIDQHAADERCRLEALMRDYFVPSDGAGPRARTETLETPLTFEFDAHECDLLRRYSAYWSRWGVIYRVRPPTTDDDQRRPLQPEDERPRRRPGVVDVTSLPPSILERSCAEPRLLVGLLRHEIWRLEDGGVGPPPRTGTGADWVTNFHGCPQGILDMLHSRSCRSAIMFNDELSLEACGDLLRRLSRCVFPFQCAHGRPSMVPLVDMESLAYVFRGETTERGGFGKRLRQLGVTDT